MEVFNFLNYMVKSYYKKINIHKYKTLMGIIVEYDTYFYYN